MAGSATRGRRRRSSRAVSRPTSAAGSRRRSSAPRRSSESHDYDEAVAEFERAARRRRRDRLARARGAGTVRRGPGAHAARGRRGRRSTLLPGGARARRGAAVLGRRPSRRGLPARHRAATSSRASRRRSRSFDEALELADRSGLPCDRLRAEILGWRSRCRRRQRDFEAAREDVELALELAQAAMRPSHGRAHLFPGIARRRADGSLGPVAARTRSRRASIYQELEDERNVGRLMLNLGGLQLLLGKPDEAIEHLKASFALAVETGSPRTRRRLWGASPPSTSSSATTRRRRITRAGRSTFSRAETTSSTRSVGLSSPGPSAHGAGTPRRGGGVLPGRGRRVRAVGVDRAPGGGVGRAGGPRGASGGRPRGSAPVPERRPALRDTSAAPICLLVATPSCASLATD